MSWSVGYDEHWKRDVGYGVPAICDYPGCNEAIDRGLDFVCCDQEPYGGSHGCGLYFCAEHSNHRGRCARCVAAKPPFDPKPDTPEWVSHKATDPSWAEWRKGNA